VSDQIQKRRKEEERDNTNIRKERRVEQEHRQGNTGEGGRSGRKEIERKDITQKKGRNDTIMT